MTNSTRPSIDVTHTTLSVIFLALLGAAAFWVLRPFLTSIVWATIVSVAAWPLLLRLDAMLGRRRGLAVTLITVTILLVVFVPVTLALVTIVKNAREISAEIRSLDSISVPGPPAALERVPIAGERLADEWRQFAALSPEQRSAAVTPHVQTALQWFAAKAGSLGTMLIQFLLTTVIAAILFAKGEVVRDGILRFATRLAGRHGHDVAILAAQTIRGVVLGVVGTALIQTAVGGLGLLVTGVPAAALLSAVMLFFCLAQLGPILVMIPPVAWLYWSGSGGRGTTLLVFAVVAGTLDNFVRPILIKRGANVPIVLIFSGVIGGLIAFGIVGLFIGPVVLTVAYTLLASWVSQAPADMAR
jgi:predicted PurR-regulated permease PerM